MKLAILSLLLVLACVHATPASTAPAKSLYDELSANKDTTQLVKLINQVPALVTALQGTTQFTVFAPSNDAINALSPDIKKALENVTFLTMVLEYHVFGGILKSGNLRNELSFPSINDLSDKYANLRVNLYNGKAYINGQQVISADNEASNGLFHVLNGVLVPPAKQSVSAAIRTNASLGKLYSLLQKFGLNDTLENQLQVTVFAPTDAAFNQLKKYAVDLSDADLENILLYHVVSGTYFSSAFTTTSMSLPTLDAKRDAVSVVVQGNGVKVNTNANVVQANIVTDNGVVHLIDRVLAPPSSSSSTQPTSSSSTQPTSSSSTQPTSSSPSGSTSTDSTSTYVKPSTQGASTRATSTQPGSTHVSSSQAANPASTSSVSLGLVALSAAAALAL